MPSTDMIETHGQLSLVALFGDKSSANPELRSLLQAVQAELTSRLGEDYLPYSEARIHATIIGLEGDRVGDWILNRNAYQRLGQLQAMELEAAVDFLIQCDDLLPLNVKIGGYKAEREYPFSSAGLHPHQRSFSIQGPIAVLMGWPYSDGGYTLQVDNLRRAFNRFRIFHKYHVSTEAVDNDLFMVMGRIAKPLDAVVARSCETAIRELLAQTDLPPIAIGQDQLSVMTYHEGDTGFLHANPLTLQEAKQRITELNWFYSEFTGG